MKELEEMLGSNTPDDLRELCACHRERVRRQIDAMDLPSGVEVERVDPTPGTYRKPGGAGMVKVTFDKPASGLPQGARKGGQVVMAIAGFVMLVSTCIAVTVPSARPGAMTVFGVGLMFVFLGMLIGTSAGRPIRQLTLEDGRDALEAHLIGRSGERVLRQPVGHCRIDHVFKSADGGSWTYLRFQGPDIDALVSIVRGDRAMGRAAAIRLEDALRLSGPAPAKKNG
ncbi:MAG: hypothetical protein JJ863_36435 [Deltaproteobacteria bacterium]|nr:hypothetical protein [Deltaproteobacteria bacterium]